MRLSPRLIGFGAAAIALALDQAHKFYMLRVFEIETRPPLQLTPFLDLTLSWNYGVSYSFFQAHDGTARLALLAFQFGVIAVLVVWMLRANDGLRCGALGLIIGGALGNAADRLLYGAVADFFHLHTTLPVGPLANYVFNVADAAITLGVALLLYDAWRAQPPAAQG
jgi:signal peptidase II